MFPSKNKNRKRCSNHRTPGKFWDDSAETEKPRGGRKAPQDPREKVHQLNAQIGALESFLQTHHEAEVSRLKMKSQNILPPPEHYASREARPNVLSFAEKRRYDTERSKNGIQFLGLLTLACAIGWWILYAPV